MNAQFHGSDATRLDVETFLSGAFGRIRLITIALAVITIPGASLLFGWRSGLGTGIGAIVGYINLVWLHHGSNMIMERLIAPADKAPSKFRLVLSFTARYVFVISIACVILKGFPSMLLSFIVAIFLPILAAMCEGIYEACVNAGD